MTSEEFLSHDVVKSWMVPKGHVTHYKPGNIFLDYQIKPEFRWARAHFRNREVLILNPEDYITMAIYFKLWDVALNTSREIIDYRIDTGFYLTQLNNS